MISFKLRPKQTAAEHEEVDQAVEKAVAPADQQTAQTPTGPVDTSKWTKGRSLSTRFTTVALWVALACGPVALITAMTAPDPVAPAAQTGPTTAGLTATDQLAGSTAASFVAAWMTSTRDDPSPIEGYLSDASIKQLEPMTYRDLMVAVVRPVNDGLVVVDVSATVKELAADGSGVEHWIPRLYEVTVNTADGAATVQALPALVATPSTTEPTTEQLKASASNTTEPGLSVQTFLSSYLTGGADLDRLVAPGSTIVAPSPAPYVAVSARDIKTNAETPEAADGAEIQVVATVEAAAATEQSAVLTYALTLSARDGRWEVVSINPAPITTT